VPASPSAKGFAQCLFKIIERETRNLVGSERLSFWRGEVYSKHNLAV
jgi:hypothetical protein